MEEQNKLGEGLIPKLIKKWKFRKKFTKEELEELEQIKKQAFMDKMREKAKQEGEDLAKRGDAI